MPNDLTITTDFPGGNIIVDSIEGDDVFLHQDLRDTQGDWFYWSFKVQGAAGRRITFHFTGSKVIGSRGPAFNIGDDLGWQWDERYGPQDRSFSFDFGPGDDDVHFAFAFPYTQSDLDAFLELHRNAPGLRVESLCKTRQGRDVELLRIGPDSGAPEHRILLTGRHHACESMTSFALEGFLDEVLADTEDGRWFRSTTELMVVPIIDKDGVEAGDQGKNRRPYDHNRDYGGTSIYPEIAALREIVPAWSDGRLNVALDFHCPARSGDWHEHIHFVEPECDPARNAWGAIQALATRIETMNTSPLPYSADRNLAFGQRWNVSDPNHTNFASWAMSFDEVALSATFEFPYANVNGVQVTPGKARQFGRVMAKAVRSYLDDDGKTA